MPSSLQYPLERSPALQEKWLRMQEPPPRDEDDEDDEHEEEGDNQEKPEPAVIREPDEDE